VTNDLLSSAPYLHAAVYQRIAPVALPGMQGVTLYLEQGICIPANRPCRLRVYQILRQNDVLITKIFKLKNEDDVVGAFVKPELIAAIDPDMLDEHVGMFCTKSVALILICILICDLPAVFTIIATSCDLFDCMTDVRNYICWEFGYIKPSQFITLVRLLINWYPSKAVYSGLLV
jgi:hypothetical protein